MSFRSWIIAVVFGLTLSGSVIAQENVGEPVVQPENTQPQSTDQAPDLPPLGLPPAATPTDPSSYEHQEDAAADANNEPYNLPDIILGDGWAQWAMVILALFGVLISAWAVWLLKKTLDATLIAVREGEKATTSSLTAADAARETNAIMRQEQRPWVTIERDVNCNFLDQGGFQGELCWNYNFVNKGKTPAYSIRSNTHIIKSVGRPDYAVEIERFAEACLAKHRDGGTPVIFPGETTKNKRFTSFSMNTYQRPQREKVVVEGDSFAVLFCLTYRTGLAENAPIGIEASVFIVDETVGEFGPWRHKMLEYSALRIIL
jgi:hypothetical protein